MYNSNFWQRLCKIIKHPWFEYGVDAVLVFNALLLLVESAEALSGEAVQRDGDISDKVRYYNAVWPMLPLLAGLADVVTIIRTLSNLFLHSVLPSVGTAPTRNDCQGYCRTPHKSGWIQAFLR